MVTVEQQATRRGDVTLVHVVVSNESGERRSVRLDVECASAMWPPRRRGVPEAGWDADGVVVTVAAGGVRGLGFATPAEAAAVDVTVADTIPRGRVESHGESPPADDEARSLDGVVRALGAFAPPLAATPREEPVVDDREYPGSAEQSGRPE